MEGEEVLLRQLIQQQQQQQQQQQTQSVATPEETTLQKPWTTTKWALIILCIMCIIAGAVMIIVDQTADQTVLTGSVTSTPSISQTIVVQREFSYSTVSGTVGVAITPVKPVITEGIDFVTYSVDESTPLPDGLTLDPASGTLYGTPTEAFTGTITIHGNHPGGYDPDYIYCIHGDNVQTKVSSQVRGNTSLKYVELSTETITGKDRSAKGFLGNKYPTIGTFSFADLAVGESISFELSYNYNSSPNAAPSTFIWTYYFHRSGPPYVQFTLNAINISGFLGSGNLINSPYTDTVGSQNTHALSPTNTSGWRHVAIVFNLISDTVMEYCMYLNGALVSRVRGVTSAGVRDGYTTSQQGNTGDYSTSLSTPNVPTNVNLYVDEIIISKGKNLSRMWPRTNRVQLSEPATGSTNISLTIT